MSRFTEKFYYSSPVWMQNWLVTMMGYKLYKRRYAGDVAKQIRRDLEMAATWDRNQIEAYQGERLHQMVKFCAEHIPYYQQKFAEYQLKPADITSVKDLNKIPILPKDVVRQNSDALKNRLSKPYMVQNTSGSTGTPLSIWVDEYTYKLAMALLVQHEERFGVHFGERRATFAGRMVQPISDLTPPFSRFNKAENQLLFSSYHLNKDTFRHYEKELNDFAPNEIIGYPSSIYELAFQFKAHNSKPTFDLKAIITNSETLLDWQRETIEDVFGVNVRDYYGTAEYVTFSGQCELNNYHLSPIIGITEVTNESDDCVFEQEGIVTTTTLTNYSMPLLRYQLGDRAVLSNKTCGCGKQSRFLTKVLGRIDDVIITESGRKIGRVDHIFKGQSGIKEAQIIQKDLARCEIHIVKANNEAVIDVRLIQKNLIERTSTSMAVDIIFKDSIQKNKNGKFKSVINEMTVK